MKCCLMFLIIRSHRHNRPPRGFSFLCRLGLCLRGLCFPRLLGCGSSEELGLLLSCLEPAMATFGGSVDELQGNLLARLAAHLGEQGLPNRDDLLPLARARPFDHNPILIDSAVVRETSQRRDRLLCQIILCIRIVRVLCQALADAIDLLVDLSTVKVAHLTCTRHLPLHTTRVPRPNTTDFPNSTMRLPHQSGTTPACDDTLHTLAFRHSDAIDHLILRKAIRNLDPLLKQAPNEVDLLRNGSSIHLDLLDVGPLLANLHLADLGVADRSDTIAILLDSIKLCFHGLAVRLAGLAPTLVILGECLLLALVPILVEPPLALLTQMSRPDIGEGARAPWCLDISDEPDHHHGRR